MNPALRQLLDVMRTCQRSPTPEPTAARLSAGELELLTLMATSAGNAELAERLGVSVNTVKTRLRRLYAKLDVHDREGAVRRARGLAPHGGSKEP